MVRRSTPQAKTDDVAYPVRVKFTLPRYELGSSGAYDGMREWLQRELGSYRYAWHSTQSLACGDAFAIYFRTPADALRFVAAFPDAKLADGVSSVAYTLHGRPAPAGR
jgi:hypothetical protein